MGQFKVGAKVKVIEGGNGAQGANGRKLVVCSKQSAEWAMERRERGTPRDYCGITPLDHAAIFVQNDITKEVWGLGENYKLEEIVPEKPVKKGKK